MPTIADTGRRLVVAFWCGPEEGSTHGSLWVTTREHAAATMRERAAVPTPQQPQGPVAHPQQGALRPGPQPQGSTARASSTGNAANGANVATPARPNTTDVPPKGVAQPSSSANPSSLPWSANSWSTPVEVAVGLVREASVGGLRRLPIGNPVLCFLPDAKPGAKKGGGKRGGSRLVLFYRVWWKAAWGMVMVSNDEGRTWGEPSRLPANVTGPAKSKPLMLDSGRLLYGASSGTRRGNKVAIEWTGDQGVTWHSSGWINGRGTVLPASFPALFWGGGPPEERAAGSPGPRGPLRMIAEAPRRVGRLVQAVSADLGTTWGPLFVSKLPSAECGIDAATLRSGTTLLLYSHSNRDCSQLNLATTHQGEAWDAALTLEQGGPNVTFPALVESLGPDGLVHIVYAYNDDVIKYALVDPSLLVPRGMAVNDAGEAVWPR